MMVRATAATAIVIKPVISRSGEVALPIRTDGSRYQNVWPFSSDRQESQSSILLYVVVTAVRRGSGSFSPELRQVMLVL